MEKQEWRFSVHWRKQKFHWFDSQR